MEMESIDTSKSEFKDNYKLLIGAILPRPIAVVSTISENGANNVAPFSFFTAVSSDPMIVAFSPLINSSTGKTKDTPINIIREKEFVINVVSEEIAEKVNLCASNLPYGEDEFTFSGLTPIDSDLVKPKRIKESMIHFECKLRDRLDYGDHVGAGQIITGEVVKAHVAKEIFHKGRIDTQKLAPVGRGAGLDWFYCRETFSLNRDR